MRVNGKDLGGTSPEASLLPPDVRLPFRRMRLSEFTGQVGKTRDSEFCVIDNVPSFGTPRTFADKGHMDGSRHEVGIHHIWQGHPHATRTVGDGVLNPERSSFPRPWVPDGIEHDKSTGRLVVKYRRIDIEEVTVLHDCANHLPE